MSKPFAYHRQRYVLAPGDAGPTVAAVIERQRDGQTGQPRHFLQPPVDLGHLVLVLIALPAILTQDDRKEITRRIRGILVQNVLHLAGPFHGEQLAGLFPAIRDISVGQVRFPQVGHIDKRHTSCAETENEHVARIVKKRKGGKVKPLDALDVRQRHTPFHRLVDSAIHMLEGMHVADQSQIDGRPIVGAQDAHVKRRSVARKALIAQIGLIKLYHAGIHHTEGQVRISPEPHETVERGLVGLAGTDTPHLSLMQDLGTDKTEHAS